MKNIATNAAITNTVEKDSVGGGRVLESGIYKCRISLAYLTVSEGGATGLVIEAKSDNDETIKQTLWVTAGAEKGGKTFYMDKNDKPQYLHGFLMAQSLTNLTIGKKFEDVTTEIKVIKIYNFEAKAEVPTKVEMITELLNKEIIIGLIKQTTDKIAKGDDGKYHPTGETRDGNELDKFFRAVDGKTSSECLVEGSEAEFIKTWAAKWTGVTKDKSTKVAGAAGKHKPTGSTGSTPKPAQSLFSQD